MILLTLTVSIVKTQTQVDKISKFAKDISETVIGFAKDVITPLREHLNINFSPDSNLYLLAVLIAVIAISYLAITKIRKKRRYKITEKFEVRYHPATTKEKEPLYAKCAYCGRTVYLPYKCNYCGQYFCDDHRLPFNHNCPGIGSYKDKNPPPGGKWRYRRS